MSSYVHAFAVVLAAAALSAGCGTEPVGGGGAGGGGNSDGGGTPASSGAQGDGGSGGNGSSNSTGMPCGVGTSGPPITVCIPAPGTAASGTGGSDGSGGAGGIGGAGDSGGAGGSGGAPVYECPAAGDVMEQLEAENPSLGIINETEHGDLVDGECCYHGFEGLCG